MKTQTTLLFNEVIKKGFTEILKSQGFKKKGNNFYLQLDDLGQIINIQKSRWNSQDQIEFTLNIGIFLPEYWLSEFNFHNKELPKFPSEAECMLRYRIGELSQQSDIWFTVDQTTNLNELIAEMHQFLDGHIFPFFQKINNKAQLIQYLDNHLLPFGTPLAKLITYTTCGELVKAQNEYLKLIRDPSLTAYIHNKVQLIAAAYKLDSSIS